MHTTNIPLKYLLLRIQIDLQNINHMNYRFIPESSQDPLLTPLVQLKEEAVSPPPPSSNEMVPLVNDQQLLAAGRHSSSSVGGGGNGGGPTRLSLAATRALTESTRILPPSEPRQNGTCYFCKKAFMKNKQLMNHVCPKKPKPK